MPRRDPEPRSALTLLLALALHAALLGVVLLLPPARSREKPPTPPSPRRWEHPVRLGLPGGGGGPRRTTRVRPPKDVRPLKDARPPTPRTPPATLPVDEPSPPAAVAQAEEPAGVADGREGPGDPGGIGPGRGEDDGGGEGPWRGPGDGERGGEAPEARREPVVLTGEMTPPVLLRRVEPSYPVMARRAGARGTVVLQCIILADGSVKVREVELSVAFLDEAAIEAVEQWRFRPALWNDRPQAVYQTVKVQFQRR